MATLDAWLAENTAAERSLIARLRERRELAARELTRVTAQTYLSSLQGTLGVDPSLYR
jgi:hypothetical protein